MVDYLAGRRLGASLAGLAERFEISERQVRRDVEAIRAAGYCCDPVTVEGATGFQLVEGRPGALRLSIRERYALLAVRGVFDVLQGTPLAQDVHKIFDKVVASLPAAQRESAEWAGRFIYVPDAGAKHYGGAEDVLDGLLTGVIHSLRVQCVYVSARGNRREGLLEPYSLVLYRQGLYVIGALDDDSGIRTFAAERFESADHVRGSTFERPADFSPEHYMEGAFGLFTGGTPTQVAVEFEREVAHLVLDRCWHPSQTIRRTRGGRVRLDLEVTNLTQLAQWLVGWGPRVRVLKPKALAEQVRKEHEDALRRT